MMKPVKLEVVASPGCHNCRAFEEFWQSVAAEWPNVTFSKHDITTPEGQRLASRHMILSSPGIILNGELVATGGFDREKFLAKLHALSD